MASRIIKFNKDYDSWIFNSSQINNSAQKGHGSVPKKVTVRVPKRVTKKYNYKDNIKTEEFESFWNNYPKKVAKKDAELMYFYEVCKDEKTFQEIITSLNNQKQSEQWTKNNGQYIYTAREVVKGRKVER